MQVIFLCHGGNSVRFDHQNRYFRTIPWVPEELHFRNSFNSIIYRLFLCLGTKLSAIWLLKQVQNYIIYKDFLRSSVSVLILKILIFRSLFLGNMLLNVLTKIGGTWVVLDYRSLNLSNQGWFYCFGRKFVYLIFWPKWVWSV